MVVVEGGGVVWLGASEPCPFSCKWPTRQVGLGVFPLSAAIPAGALTDTGCFLPRQAGENGSDSDPAVRDTALPPLNCLFSEENALPPWVIVKFFTCKGCPTRCKQGTSL